MRFDAVLGLGRDGGPGEGSEERGGHAGRQGQTRTLWAGCAAGVFKGWMDESAARSNARSKCLSAVLYRCQYRCSCSTVF